mmetsp:Transcript_19403/g.61026  ORF Transcript_19403/g.61026 Transcript_19403/m.61026 type:complete len:206 (+) Transcript_19403:340-957(+)
MRCASRCFSSRASARRWAWMATARLRTAFSLSSCACFSALLDVTKASKALSTRAARTFASATSRDCCISPTNAETHSSPVLGCDRLTSASRRCRFASASSSSSSCETRRDVNFSIAASMSCAHESRTCFSVSSSIPGNRPRSRKSAPAPNSGPTRFTRLQLPGLRNSSKYEHRFRLWLGVGQIAAIYSCRTPLLLLSLSHEGVLA